MPIHSAACDGRCICCICQRTSPAVGHGTQVLIIGSIVFFLMACTAIESPPDQEVKAGLSDLSSALAKADDNSEREPDEYALLLHEFSDCYQKGVGEEKSAGYSPTEKVALAMYSAGILAMVSPLASIFSSMEGNSQSDSSAEEEAPESNYELLEGALAACVDGQKSFD